MRIISGSLGGRRLIPPPKFPARPTTDMARVALFNILDNHFDYTSLSIADLFAGSGSIGIEFISRGCSKVCCVERNSTCTAFIRKTIRDWDIDGLEVYEIPAERFIWLNKMKFNIIFADPPYEYPAMLKLPELVLNSGRLEENGWFILEHGPRTFFNDHPACFDNRKYGEVNFSFFK